MKSQTMSRREPAASEADREDGMQNLAIALNPRERVSPPKGDRVGPGRPGWR
jgi:hypothetical protein